MAMIGERGYVICSLECFARDAPKPSELMRTPHDKRITTRSGRDLNRSHSKADMPCR